MPALKCYISSIDVKIMHLDLYISSFLLNNKFLRFKEMNNKFVLVFIVI